MSQTPSHYPGQQGAYPRSTYQPPPSNGLGLAGFIVSLIGLIVCAGFLGPIGLILSLFALGKEPRGFAIGGAVIGLLGSISAALIVMAFTGVIGSGFSASQFFGGSFYYSPTNSSMDSASSDFDNYYANNNDTLPDEATGNAMVSSYYDEWNTPLRYRPLANSTDTYELTSAGPDMAFDTADDITVPYTAFNYGIYAAPHQAQPQPQNAPTDKMNELAFDKGAKQINMNFSPGAPLPNLADGNAALSGQRDAWGSPITYTPTNDPFYTLTSAGPDGVAGNDDDIVRSFFFEPIGSEP